MPSGLRTGLFNARLFSGKGALAGLLGCALYGAAALFSPLPASAAGVKLLAVVTSNESVGKLNQPSGLYFDENKKRLYIADSASKRIVSLDNEFKFLAELTNKEMLFPTDIVKNNAGQFYAVDAGKSRVLFIDTKKEQQVEPFNLKVEAAGNEMLVPGRMSIDKADRLYIVDRLNRRILVFDQGGRLLKTITVKDEGFHGFNDARADSEGNVYALDTLAGRVYVFDSEGNPINRFGSRDPSDRVSFKFPVSLAVGKEFIYVLDRHAGTILAFNKSGNLHHVISRKGDREGELYSPSYVYVDESDRIFVIDGNRVQVFKEDKE